MSGHLNFVCFLKKPYNYPAMRKCVFVILLASLGHIGFSQSHKLQSVFIYTFTKNVMWPDGNDQGDFEIAVLGDSPLFELLVEMSKTKKVGERAIKISQIQNVAEIKPCSILFVAAVKSNLLAEVLAKVNAQPTLIVTEGEGLGQKGSDINFITKEGKLAFELNQAAVNKRNLKISNNLVGLAILI
jgi:hypothetical protein